MGAVNFHGDIQDNLVPIDSVRQHPDNPNNGNVEAIAESILANGFYNPVVVQRSTGYILAGNHRYAALLSLGETSIPAIFVDIDDNKALRVLVADNRTAELAVRNRREVLSLLESLSETEEGTIGTGYDDDGIEELKRLVNIDDHAGFGMTKTSGTDYDFEPHIIVKGRLRIGGGFHPFEPDEIDEVVEQLREDEWHVIGRSEP